MNQISLLLENQDVEAIDGVTFDRLNPITGEVATRAAAAADRRRQARGRCRGGGVSGLVGDRARARAARSCSRPPTCSRRKAPNSSRRWRPRPAPPPAGPASTSSSPPACCARRRDDDADHRRGDPVGQARAASRWRIRQPAGVVLGIAPWNAPVILGVRAIAMPLACGNTVVLKASEMCPGTHRADRPNACARPACRRGVVNVVTNAPADAAESSRR